jgi:hypothetical protein
MSINKPNRQNKADETHTQRETCIIKSHRPFPKPLILQFCINPVKTEVHTNNNYKNSVRTAKKTQHFTITKINWLTLFKEIIAVYSENHTKPINTHCGQNRELCPY